MKIKIRRKRLDAFFYFGFIYVGIIVDNIVGNKMRITGEDSIISKSYRLVFFAFLFYILFKRHYKENIRFLLLFFIAMLLPIFQAINSFSFNGIITDELYIMKLLFPIYLVLVGYILKKDNIIDFKDVEQCLSNMSWIFPLTIIVPYFLGLGFKAYGNSSGYVAFYFAGNELSIVLSVMFIFQLEKMSRKVSVISLTGVILSAISVLLTGTKTSILIICLAILYFFISKKFGTKKLISFLGIVILLGVLFIVMKGFLQEEITTNISRWQFRFSQLNRNVIDFMFSNRNRKIMPNITVNFNSVVNFFLGRGYYAYFHRIGYKGEMGVGRGLIEMDIFDIFCCYGILVTVFVYKFYIGNLVKNRKQGKSQYFFAVICVLMFSSLAGHTLFSAMPGTVLALLYLGISFENRENNILEEKNEKDTVFN